MVDSRFAAEMGWEEDKVAGEKEATVGLGSAPIR